MVPVMNGLVVGIVCDYMTKMFRGGGGEETSSSSRNTFMLVSLIIVWIFLGYAWIFQCFELGMSLVIGLSVSIPLMVKKPR